MGNNIVKLILLIMVLSLLSCAKKLKFTDNELKIFNVYEKGDTLVFENISKKIKDTSIIVNKGISYDRQLFAYSKYRTPIAFVQYSNKTLLGTDKMNLDDMIAMSKSSENSERIYSINYLKSHFLFNAKSDIQTYNLEISKKEFVNVYKLTCDTKNTRGHNLLKNNPKYLYWDIDYGIIKYITFDGEVWERINW